MADPRTSFPDGDPREDRCGHTSAEAADLCRSRHDHGIRRGTWYGHQAYPGLTTRRLSGVTRIPATRKDINPSESWPAHTRTWQDEPQPRLINGLGGHPQRPTRPSRGPPRTRPRLSGSRTRPSLGREQLGLNTRGAHIRAGPGPRPPSREDPLTLGPSAPRLLGSQRPLWYPIHSTASEGTPRINLS